MSIFFKALCLGALILISTANASEAPRHMVSFGTNGLGWSGASEEIDTNKRSPFKSVDYFLNNLSLNYAIRLFSHLQLGAFYQNYEDEYEFHHSNGKSKSALQHSKYGTFLLYNFSKNLTESFYLGAAFSFFNTEEENSHDFTEAEGKAPFELDDEGQTYEFIIGKRFSLESFGIKHITYSPMVSFYHRQHGKDFDDQGARKGKGIFLQILKFDVLF